ncbi:AAA family ATPase [Deinococcus sp. SM5_A1]|uniref:AAA family ATPase n=1 Tax=Deinococcus sp. SM5_A1 TaxID=3379094 RepID=UPI00385BEB22
MNLTTFRITNFRSVIDSGEIDVNDLTVLVGKNESGKSSVLQVLYLSNPMYSEAYSVNTDWPRSDRVNRDSSEIVCTMRFSLSDEEIAKVKEIIDDNEIEISFVEVRSSYDQLFPYVNGNPKLKYTVEYIKNFYDQYAIDHLPQDIPELDNYVKRGRNFLPSWSRKKLLALVAEAAEKFGPSDEKSIAAHVKDFIDDMVSYLDKFAMMESKIDKWITDTIPKFIYLDEYSTFRGRAELSVIHSRFKAESLTSEDKTFLTILDLAGLDVEQEIEKSTKITNMERQLDIDDASRRLTNFLKNRWSQRNYKIQFRVDGDNFYTFVEDDLGGSLIDLEERSKGFKWFFSFDLTLAYGIKRDYKNTIIILDEPGIYLHPDAQIDMLRRLEEYSENNTIIYSTHLPFMIDLKYPERIRVVRDDSKGTTVDYDILSGDNDTKFVLQSALGMDYAQNFFISDSNVVTEGVHDYWLLTAFDNLLRRLGKESLESETLISPSRGAHAAALLTTFMIGQKLKVVCLLDSDDEGNAAHKELKEKWLLKVSDGRASVLQINTILSRNGLFTIEDLVPEKMYTEAVKELYGKDLKDNGVARISFPSGNMPILDRIIKYMELHNVTRFNKGSVMRIIRDKINSTSSEEHNSDLVEVAEKTIKMIKENIK